MSNDLGDDDPAGVMYGSEVDPIVGEFESFLTGSAELEANLTGSTEAIEASESAIYATKIASAMNTSTSCRSDFRTRGEGQ